jgi:hypothetical protein
MLMECTMPCKPSLSTTGTEPRRRGAPGSTRRRTYLRCSEAQEGAEARLPRMHPTDGGYCCGLIGLDEPTHEKVPLQTLGAFILMLAALTRRW